MLSVLFTIWKAYSYAYVALSCLNTVNEIDAYYKKKLEEAE